MSGGGVHNLLEGGQAAAVMLDSKKTDNNNDNAFMDDGFGQRGPGAVLEAENVALVVIFALLLLFVTMTGLVVYSLCGGRESAAAARANAAAAEGGYYGGQHRSWASLATVLMLTMVRLERNEARMADIEHELVI